MAPDLGPCGLHELLLVLADHARAEAGDDAVGGGGVELGEPVGIGESLDAGLPALEPGVDAGADAGEIGVGDAGLAGGLVGAVDGLEEFFALLGGPPPGLVGDVRGLGAGGDEGAAEDLEGAGGVRLEGRDAGARAGHVDDAPADVQGAATGKRRPASSSKLTSLRVENSQWS